METKKWFIRIGSLLILLGFVLPSLTVSCAMAPEAAQTVSLMDLAGDSQLDMQLLILVPLGALLTLVLALLPASLRLNPVLLLLGELGGIGLGILSSLVILIIFSNRMQEYMFTVSPAYGIFVLIAGYALAAIGGALYLPEFFGGMRVSKTDMARANSVPTLAPMPQTPSALPQAYPPSYTESPMDGLIARLHILRGSANQPQYLLQDNFTIGRSSQNQIQLSGETVSRQHARLRYAQGVWFIQDEESLTGTFVNGERVSATRLKPGDTITIGETVLRFDS